MWNPSVGVSCADMNERERVGAALPESQCCYMSIQANEETLRLQGDPNQTRPRRRATLRSILGVCQTGRGRNSNITFIIHKSEKNLWKKQSLNLVCVNLRILPAHRCYMTQNHCCIISIDYWYLYCGSPISRVHALWDLKERARNPNSWNNYKWNGVWGKQRGAWTTVTHYLYTLRADG